MKRQSNSGRDSPSKKPKQQALSFVSSSASKPDRATQEEDDARFARELADREGILGALEWDEKRREKLNDKGMSKGKGTASEPKAEPEVDDSGSDDCIIVEEPKQPNTTTASGKAIFASADLQKPSPTSKPKRPSTPGQPRTTSASPGTKPTTFSFFSPAQPVASTFATCSFKSLDTPVYAFNPKTDVDTSRWPSSRLPYSYLTSAFVLISSTKRRLTILRVLTNLLRVAIELDPASLLAVVYLSTNRLGPAHERDLELGIGSQVLGKAIREVSGLTPAALRSLSNKLGDAGDIAFEAKKTVRLLLQPPPLVCHSLYSTLLSLTKLKGTGSQESRTAAVKKLIVAAQGEEIRYVTRTLVSNLRIGAVKLTILSAIAKAFCLSRKGGGKPDDGFFVGLEERMEIMKTGEGKKGKGKAAGKGKEKEDVERMVEEKLQGAEMLVRKVWARHPDYGHLVDALLVDGLADLETRVPLAVGTPLEPMLGSPTRAISEIYTRLGSRPFIAEAKLDGQRGQIHVSTEEPQGMGENGRGRWYDPPARSDGRRIWVRVFSRHLEDMSDKYPDILPTLSALVARESTGTDDPLTSFIIDCEIVAIDPSTGAFKTFQELSHRSRKDVEMGDIKVRVGIYAFDLMFLNGKSVLSEPFRRRRDLLKARFAPLRPTDARWAKWELVPSCIDNDPDKVKEFFDETLKMKAEGIMVKLLDEAVLDVDSANSDEADADLSSSKSKRPKTRKVLPATYEPDKRADSWLKVKKDYLEDLGDSLDLVPIGAWHGNGRKAAWWSPILLGCYDQDTGLVTAVCKCMSGFTDAFYQELNVRYAPGGERTSRTKPGEIEAGNLEPPIWFKPSEVWEIRGADFTLSPVYPAAQALLGERGVSIRFPRFIKIREDKGVEDATTAEQLAEMYERQREGRGAGKREEGE